MRKTLAPIPIALFFAAILFCGCTRESSTARVSRRAVLRGKQESKRLYHIEPFREEHGQWRIEDQHRVEVIMSLKPVMRISHRTGTAAASWDRRPAGSAHTLTDL